MHGFMITREVREDATMCVSRLSRVPDTRCFDPDQTILDIRPREFTQMFTVISVCLNNCRTKRQRLYQGIREHSPETRVQLYLRTTYLASASASASTSSQSPLILETDHPFSIAFPKLGVRIAAKVKIATRASRGSILNFLAQLNDATRRDATE